MNGIYSGYVPVEFPAAMYKPGKLMKTAASREEKNAMLADGWFEHPDCNPPVPAVPEKAMPPSLETVMKAGYSMVGAAVIVAEEWQKFAAGEPPYGEAKPEPAGPPVVVALNPAPVEPPAEVKPPIAPPLKSPKAQ